MEKNKEKLKVLRNAENKDVGFASEDIRFLSLFN